jgi:hypothetical protein
VEQDFCFSVLEEMSSILVGHVIHLLDRFKSQGLSIKGITIWV